MSLEHRTGTVDVDGETVYFEVTGDGPPLVLCHGAGGNHAIWFQQVVALADRYTVITWDHRGFGCSGRTKGVGDPKVSIGDLAAVLDAADAPRAHVVAQSMGGWTALGFTLTHPERVVTLTLADTVAGASTPAVEQNWKDYLGRFTARGTSTALGEVFPLGRRFIRDDPAGAALYQAIGSLNGSSGEELRGILSATWPLEDIKALALPTLFIVGEEDDIFPPPVIRDIASNIAGSEVAVIAGCGHSPYFESPDEWNAVVGRFVDRHPA